MSKLVQTVVHAAKQEQHVAKTFSDLADAPNGSYPQVFGLHIMSHLKSTRAFCEWEKENSVTSNTRIKVAMCVVGRPDRSMFLVEEPIAAHAIRRVFVSLGVEVNEHGWVVVQSLSKIFSWSLSRVLGTACMSVVQIERDYTVPQREFGLNCTNGFLVHPIVLLGMAFLIREELFVQWVRQVVVDAGGYIDGRHFDYISPPFLFTGVYGDDCLKSSLFFRDPKLSVCRVPLRKKVMRYKLNKLNYKRMLEKSPAFHKHVQNNPQEVPSQDEAFVTYIRDDGKFTEDAADPRILSLEDERHPRYQEDCSVCLDAPSEVVLLPCGHRQVCKSCSKALSTCMMCREPIERVQPIYACSRTFVPLKQLEGSKVNKSSKRRRNKKNNQKKGKR